MTGRGQRNSARLHLHRGDASQHSTERHSNMTVIKMVDSVFFCNLVLPKDRDTAIWCGCGTPKSVKSPAAAVCCSARGMLQQTICCKHSPLAHTLVNEEIKQRISTFSLERCPFDGLYYYSKKHLAEEIQKARSKSQATVINNKHR